MLTAASTAQYHGASAAVAVLDNSAPPAATPPEGPCSGMPTASIDDVGAKRSDAAVTSMLGIDCEPSGAVAALLSEAVNDILVTESSQISLPTEQQSQTYTMNVRPAGELSLVMSYSFGAANRLAAGKINFESVLGISRAGREFRDRPGDRCRQLDEVAASSPRSGATTPCLTLPSTDSRSRSD